MQLFLYDVLVGNRGGARSISLSQYSISHLILYTIVGLNLPSRQYHRPGELVFVKHLSNLELELTSEISKLNKASTIAFTETPRTKTLPEVPFCRVSAFQLLSNCLLS